MMCMVFFSFIIFSFSNSFGMSDDAKRLSLVTLVSQQEYNDRVYSLSRAQRTELEYARNELSNNPQSDAAQKRLKNIADQGYVPALYPLIINESGRGDIVAATNLSYQGAFQGDPASALTLASLYAPQPDTQEDEQALDTRNQLRIQWLNAASTKRVLYDPVKLELVGAYVHDSAKRYLHESLQEQQKKSEELFSQYSDAQLNQGEKDILNGCSDTILASFLIKRHVDNGSTESKKRAIGLAEKIVASESFHPEQFRAAGARVALESLNTEQTPAKIKTRASQLLTVWDQKEAGMFELVPVHPLESAKPKFVAPDCSSESFQALIDGAENNFEGTACVDAAMLLNMHRNRYERVKQAVKIYLERALRDSDPAVKRALIEQCQLNPENLYPFYVKAFNQYAHELSLKDGLLQEEADFMNEQLKKVMQKADKGDVQASFYAYQLLMNSPKCFTCIPVQEMEKVQTHYFKKALDAGNWEAICVSLSRMRTMAPITAEQLCGSMKFWTKAYTVSSKLSQDAPDVGQFASLAAESELKITELLELKKERGNTADDVSFYFHAAATLAPKDPTAAFIAFKLGQEIIFETRQDTFKKRELYQLTGLEASLRACAARGEGWAYFAQAYYTACSAVNPGMPMTAEQEALNIIAKMEKAKDLLRQASEATEPHKNFSEFGNYDVDVTKGIAYVNLFKVRPNEIYIQKAFELFQPAVDARNSKGMYNWARATLDGYGRKGQAAFEQAVNYLIQAATQNHPPSKECLEKMRAEGMRFAAECGGTMTSPMCDAIDACMPFHARALIESTRQKIDPVEEYKSLEEQANKGSLEAMVMLGLKCKEGSGTEKSLKNAEARFIDALLAWDGNAALAAEVRVAYAGLIETSETNVRAQIARCKASIYTFFQGGTQNETAAQEVINGLKNAHKLMQSGDEKDAELFYSSGLARAIDDCLKNYHYPDTFLDGLVDFYVQRILAFPGEVQDAQKGQLLGAPIRELITRTEGVFSMQLVRILMNDQEMQALDAVIRSLGRLIGQIKNNTDFEYLRGLLLTLQSVAEPESSVRVHPKENFRKAFTSETKQIFGSLAKRGHIGARYMNAYIAVHGHSLCSSNMNDRNRGVALFEELAAQKDVRSLLALTAIADENPGTKPKERLAQAKKMQKYLNMIIEKEPENDAAYRILIGVYVNNPTLKPAHLEDCSEQKCVDYILSLFSKSKTLENPLVDCSRVLLRIRKQEATQELVADFQKILSQSDSHNSGDDKCFETLRAHYEDKNFNTMIDRWARDCIALEREKKQPNERDIARIYALNAWMHAIMVRTYRLEKLSNPTSEVIAKKLNAAYAKFEECFKASTQNGQHASPLIYLLKGHLDLIMPQDSNGISACRQMIKAGVLIMEQQQWDLADVPMFVTCLNDYRLLVKTRMPAIKEIVLKEVNGYLRKFGVPEFT